MKKKEIEQLKNKPVVELQKNLSEYRDKLWNLKTDLVAGKVKNVEEIRQVKKTIARLLTFINQTK